MDTDLLRTFLEVSKTRHFGRAAENLYLTQSAVSFRIRQLEQQLGVSLFSRHRNNIQLTPSGEHLQPYAETIIQTLGLAKQAMVRDNTTQRAFSIGAPQICWEMGLQHWFERWITDHPSQPFKMETGHREQLGRQLVERNIDLVILTEPVKIDELTIKQIGEFELCLVSNQATLSASQLATQDFIWIDWSTNFTASAVPAELLQRMPRLQTSSYLIARQHLLKHGGIAYFPRHLIAPLVKQRELFYLDGFAALTQPLYVAYRSDSDQIEKIESIFNTPFKLSI